MLYMFYIKLIVCCRPWQRRSERWSVSWFCWWKVSFGITALLIILIFCC